MTNRSYDELIELAMADDDYVKTSEEALKPKQILELVKSSMAQGRTPDISSAELRKLCFEINKLQYHFRTYTAHWGPSLKLAGEFSAALKVILSVGPAIGAELQAGLDAVEGVASTEEISRLKDGIELLRKLHNASLDTQQNTFLKSRLLALPYEPEWEHIARRICLVFHTALDSLNKPKGASLQAGYSFAASIAEVITGQGVTTQAVETLMKRGRDVNGGRNFFHLPQGET